MIKKIFLIISLFCLSFVLFGCEDNKLPPTENEIQSINFENDISLFSLDLDEFKLEDIKIKVVYTNGDTEIIPLTKDMIKTSDFDNLFITGNYFIKIVYEGKELEATIQMSSSSPQTKLSQVVVYSTKRIEDGKAIYSFYTTSTGNYVSYYLELNHNLSNQDLEIIKQEGVFSYNIESNKIKLTHSFGKVMVGKRFLFELIVDEEVKLSFLDLDSSFYGLNDKGIVFLIEDIKYYSR